MMAKRSWSLDSRRYQHLVRGHLWTRDNPAAQFRCLIIIWRGADETWDTSAVLHRCGSRVSQTFESHNSAAAGLNQCFGWLRGFAAAHGLPPLEILEEWARLLGDALVGTSNETHGHGGLRLI